VLTVVIDPSGGYVALDRSNRPIPTRNWQNWWPTGNAGLSAKPCQESSTATTKSAYSSHSSTSSSVSAGSALLELPSHWWLVNKLHYITHFPIHVDIESTNFCNLKCTMCPHSIEDSP